MQKHCQRNSVSSVRERMLWFVYVYSFVDLHTQFKQCKRQARATYLQCSSTSRPLLLPRISDLPRSSLRVSTYTLFLSLHAVYESLLLFVRQPAASPTKKDRHQHGIRCVDKWDSSLSCWYGNISVSQRSVRQFRADVITRQREYRRRFILSMSGTSPIGNR